MIKVAALEKSFKKLKVLQGIDLEVEEGKIFAFIGPNGSGKSTLIKTILGLVIPDKGTITVNGEDVRNNYKYREQIGYMPQIARFPENLKVRELFKMIRDIRKNQGDEKPLIEYFGLGDSLDKQLKNLSGGTKQKVNAVIALMFDPAILIFDEPSVGLDPVSHLRFREKVREEKAKGKTIIITTHIISEVKELADEIIFLLDGKIWFKGEPAELMAQCKKDDLEQAIAAVISGSYGKNV